MLDALKAGGVEVAELTLHVGYGTFQPVRVDRVEDHHVEAERYEISAAAADAITRARTDSRRVIAAAVRALLPPPLTEEPFALSGPSVLDTLLAHGGLRTVGSGDDPM